MKEDIQNEENTSTLQKKLKTKMGKLKDLIDHAKSAMKTAQNVKGQINSISKNT